jgi:hypothetical protein
MIYLYIYSPHGADTNCFSLITIFLYQDHQITECYEKKTHLCIPNEVDSNFAVFDVYLSSKSTPKLVVHVKQQVHHNCFVEKVKAHSSHPQIEDENVI